ncbi:MAG: ABC transporter permease [Theionarchaea archaeon]|nr:ABC transporter permease [Theionarchaea archaeon]
MRFNDLIMVVLRNLNRIRMRTALTTMGVAIGVAAIVVLLSIAFGIQASITEQFEDIGDIRQITVLRPMQGFGLGGVSEETEILDDEAVKEIEKIDGVQAVVPSLSVSGTVEIGRYITLLSLTGIDPEKGETLEIKIEEGRFLRRRDRDVMVVGYKVADVFMEKKTLKKVEDLDILGKKGEIIVTRRNLEGEEETKSFRVRIIGIIEEQGTQADYDVYIPLEIAVDITEWQTMQSNLLKWQGYGTLMVLVADANTVNDITMQITDMGYLAFSFKQIIEGINQVFIILEIVLLAIGAVALIVAALGIINTMLMSILERTREIGIMKVVGASNRDVTRIFLMEALAIGFIGGIGGIILAFLVANGIDIVVGLYISQQGGTAESIVVMPVWLVIFALGFAMFVGLVSGVFPARKAALLSPVEALRHE